MSKAGMVIGIRLCAVVFSAFGMRAVATEEDSQKPPRGERLVALAEEFIKAEMLFKGDNGLSEAEKAFLRAVEKGKEFKRDIDGALLKERRDALNRHAEKLREWRKNRRRDAEEEAPAAPDILWPAEATLRAELITWLGTEPEVKELISMPRIEIIGCRITGTIDWSFIDVLWSLACFGCDFENAPNLIQSKLKGLHLSGSLVPGIDADRLNVTGNVTLRAGFHSRGAIRLLGATIGGNLDCTGAMMESATGKRYTLYADAMKVTGSVLMRNGFTSSGEVRLSHATIGGVLECQGATMESENGRALVADKMNVTGDVFLSEDFHSRGAVRLIGATIGGDLSCIGATMENERENRPALNADGINVEGRVFLSGGFTARGEVRLLGATIGGDLICQGATMENPRGKALNADGVNVIGNVFLRDDFHAAGRISLDYARMSSFHWYRIRNPVDAILDLRQTRAGTIWIGTKGADNPSEDLPKAGNLYLHGFTYDSIDDNMPGDADWWIDFIQRQPSEATHSKSKFLPQPYKQAARVLREAGHTEEAERVLIAMEIRRRDTLGWARKVWSYALRWSIGYGHTPGRAIWAAVFVIGVGFFVFWRGDKKRHIVAAEDWAYEKKPDLGAKTQGELVFNYPRFSALMYSIDVFIPLVNLKQAEYWIPCSGTLQMTWMRAQTALGWIVMTLLAAGLSGLVGG